MSLNLTHERTDFIEREIFPRAEGVSATQRVAFRKPISANLFPACQRGTCSVAEALSVISLLVLRSFSTQRLYKAAGDEERHRYTMTLGLPEFARAKANAANLSDVSLS